MKKSYILFQHKRQLEQVCLIEIGIWKSYGSENN